jgi:hypothetical protein
MTDRANPEAQRASGDAPTIDQAGCNGTHLESHVVRVRSTTRRLLPTRPGTALLPSAKCARGLVEPGKLSARILSASSVFAQQTLGIVLGMSRDKTNLLPLHRLAS